MTSTIIKESTKPLKKSVDFAGINSFSINGVTKTIDGQVVVVKFGGNAIMNESVLDSLVDDTIAMIKKGVHVILVHGGGTYVNQALSTIGKTTEKVNGLRVTDDETLSIAVKVFAQLNEKLTEKFLSKGSNALSFCSKSSIPLVTKKMECETADGEKVDLGWVGEIVDVDVSKLDSWLWAGWVPVVSPIGMDCDGNFYNVNADHAALAIATHLQADGLIFCTDVPGVMKDLHDPNSRISHLTPQSAYDFIEEGTITGGMLPKIKSCVAGIKGGVNQISILNSFEPHALLRGFIAPQEIGTLIA